MGRRGCFDDPVVHGLQSDATEGEKKERVLLEHEVDDGLDQSRFSARTSY